MGRSILLNKDDCVQKCRQFGERIVDERGLLWSHPFSSVKYTATWRKPIRLTQCCTQFKFHAVKVLCVFHLHDNVAFYSNYTDILGRKRFIRKGFELGTTIEYTDQFIDESKKASERCVRPPIKEKQGTELNEQTLSYVSAICSRTLRNDKCCKELLSLLIRKPLLVWEYQTNQINTFT